MKTMLIALAFALCVPVYAKTFELHAEYAEYIEPPPPETCETIMYFHKNFTDIVSTYSNQSATTPSRKRTVRVAR